MLSAELILTIFTIFIGFSGWATFLYSYYTSNPKIKGTIIQSMAGMWTQTDENDEEIITLPFLMLYLYISNMRKNIVHILNWELYVDLGNGFIRMDRVYGLDSSRPRNWTFNIKINKEEKVFKTSNIKEILFNNKLPIEYGIPLHGFILFSSKTMSFIELDDINQYKVILIDSFNKKHTIISKPSELYNFYLLQELAGIEEERSGRLTLSNEKYNAQRSTNKK